MNAEVPKVDSNYHFFFWIKIIAANLALIGFIVGYKVAEHTKYSK